MSALKIWLWVSIDASSLTTFSTNRQWSSLSHVWNFHAPFDFFNRFHSMQGYTATTRYGVKDKKEDNKKTEVLSHWQIGKMSVHNTSIFTCAP